MCVFRFGGVCLLIPSISTDLQLSLSENLHASEVHPIYFGSIGLNVKKSRAENSTSYSFCDSASLNIASESSLAGTKKI